MLGTSARDDENDDEGERPITSLAAADENVLREAPDSNVDLDT